VPELGAAVDAVLRRTAAEVVLPRFRSADTPTFQKGPGDWVTAADLESEAALSAALTDLLPGSTVVGEEAVHDDPAVLRRFHGTEPVWVIDPVDGTANFAAGREPFALIVALVVGGATMRGWIHLPMADRMLDAEAGHGARLDGRDVGASLAPVRRPRGIVPLHALPEAEVAEIRRRADAGAADLIPTVGCAGAEYPAVLDGSSDFVFFTGSMPWDHAAGALALTEAGGQAAYLDGGGFTVLDEARRPLLVARTPEIWMAVRDGLLGALD
jgi:fructose-1,6-bisphosphatase/inositol monophosphatase family enzyme